MSNSKRKGERMEQAVPAQLSINEEFKKLIPPLAPDEYAALEESIKSEGCRDAVTTWNGVIIDGHNRFEICTRHGIEFDVRESADFADENDVKLWIINNQLARRNLTVYQKTSLALQYEDIFAERAKAAKAEAGRYGRGMQLGVVTNLSQPQDHLFEPEGDTDEAEPVAKPESVGRTRAAIAKIAGASEGTVAKVKKIKEKAAPEVIAKLERGEMSVNEAAKIVKSEERKADIERQREEIISAPPLTPEGLYDVLVVDPPWNYGREYDPDGSRVANPYPEMTQAELLELDIPASDDSVMFLWTTHAFIFDAKELLDSWGFTYKATMVWDKEKIGMGHWLRMQCEFCLVGIKGKPFWGNTSWRDIIHEPRRQHSRKPDVFYEMVEDITVGRRLDFFSREQREGWCSFGNETEKF